MTANEHQAALWVAGRAADADELRRVLDVLGIADGRPARIRPVRISDAMWSDLAQTRRHMHTDRSKAIKQFIRWYVGYPGAQLPERPCDRTEAAA